MNGIIRKVEYYGDWEGFFLLAQAFYKTAEGGSIVYSPEKQRGVMVYPDCTRKLGVNLQTLEVE